MRGAGNWEESMTELRWGILSTAAIGTRRVITLAPMKTGTSPVIGPIPPATVSVCIVVEPPRTEVGPVIDVTSRGSTAWAVKSPE